MNRLTCKPDGVMENYYYETTEETISEDRITILNKLGQLEDIEEWFARKRFYGKAKNEPDEILELEFDKLDFRPEADLLAIHFKVLNSWATSIFYSIFAKFTFLYNNSIWFCFNVCFIVFYNQIFILCRFFCF